METPSTVSVGGRESSSCGGGDNPIQRIIVASNSGNSSSSKGDSSCGTTTGDDCDGVSGSEIIIIRTNCSGPSGNSEDIEIDDVNEVKSYNRDRDGGWVEQIQFKAHYQHYRSIDYASFVHTSSVSLDRVGLVALEPTASAGDSPVTTVTNRLLLVCPNFHNVCPFPLCLSTCLLSPYFSPTFTT